PAFGDKIVLKLLATVSNIDFDEHFDQALEYARLLSAKETWIVHFTCEDEYVKQPYWPPNYQLKKNLNVVHFYHDTSFEKIDLIACWWNKRKDERHIYRKKIL